MATICQGGKYIKSSKDVNGLCDEMDLEHTYRDHCSDPVVVWPFVVIDGQQVFSDPPSFHVACNNPKGVGYLADDDWRARMVEANISRKVIIKVQVYLAHHSACDCEDL